MLYSVSCPRPNLHYLHINIRIEKITGDKLQLQLPSWRPGRYELGNFAKNIQGFEVKASGTALPYRKVTKDLWEIETMGHKKLEVSYNYYAAELNAGSTFVDENMWYMNPVNCCMYVPGRTAEPHELMLDIPKGYKLACSMKKKGHGRLLAKDFDELADSPLIASPALQTLSFDLEGKTVYVHIMGSHRLDEQRLLDDFKAYSEEQVKAFGDYPCDEYHYLFHFPPFRYHHGVEHENSTVIVLGPGENLHQEEYYHELLAISSHEFYHLWNIKRIRPADMWPYDYTHENYSSLGWVYEGVTTYMGDLMLLRSKVFSFEDYTRQFNGDIQKHFDNQGRYFYSVAESSFDTWLDGYVPGVPDRKVSIYVEGMLAAFILDVELLRLTGGKYRLDDVMRILYEKHYLKGKGYTEADYIRITEKLAGQPFDWYWKGLIHGRGKVEEYLPKTLAYLGCELKRAPGTFAFERWYGAKLHSNGYQVVGSVLSGSPADKAGLSKGDRLLSVNGVQVTSYDALDTLLSPQDTHVLEISGQFNKKYVEIRSDGKTYYDQFVLEKSGKASPEQQKLFALWSGISWS